MESSFAELDSLVALITTAIEDVKAEYTKLNLPFPQLADVKSHPVDTIQVPRNLKRAVQVISGACAQLSALVLSPEETTFLVSPTGMVSISSGHQAETYLSQLANNVCTSRPKASDIAERVFAAFEFRGCTSGHGKQDRRHSGRPSRRSSYLRIGCSGKY